MSQVDAYLTRIDLNGTELPSLPFLTRLQAGHLMSVPFENLSVRRQEPILLEEERLVSKIVQRGRGGFCYELNGAFAWLLSRLGFAVARISARVYDQERNRFGLEFDHMALLVSLDRVYLVDVGFGDSVRQPLPLPDGCAKDVSGAYRIRVQNAGRYVLERNIGAKWQPQYSFDERPRELAEYAAMCAHHTTSPESSFTGRTVCTVATGKGRVTLTDNHLTLTGDNRVEKFPISSPAEFQRLLLLHFGPNFVSLPTPVSPSQQDSSCRF